MTWRWPLLGNATPPPTRGDGAFGTVRKHEVHTGVDLYCEPGQQVRAARDGYVAAIVAFTGERVRSPWWFDTDAIIVASDEECILYGEMRVDVGRFGIGTPVEAGMLLGHVLRVRKNDDGKPTTMLHLELWASKSDVLRCYSGTLCREPNDWPLGGERPVGLLDPTAALTAALVEALRAERERV